MAVQKCEISNPLFINKNVIIYTVTNLKVAGLGGFASGYYWSSSEIGAKYALLLSFSNGSQSNGSKDYSAKVRAIRAYK